jgi:hypothetical protein
VKKFILLLLFCSGSFDLYSNSFDLLINQNLSRWKQAVQNITIVAAVKKQNSQQIKTSEINRVDELWKKSNTITEFMKPILENVCAKKLQEVKKQFSYMAEIFIMDNQGALVCASDRTSDYWQGDEDKWTKTFNEKKDFIDQVNFDESTQSYLIQVSFPLYDRFKKVVGVATLGINPENLRKTE